MDNNISEFINNFSFDHKIKLNEKKTNDNYFSKLYDIAIIGLAGRFPQSENHYDFWDNLQNGCNLVQEVPKDRWDHDSFYDINAKKEFIPGKTGCKFGSFLKSISKFDADFFDIPNEYVGQMDPQERIALEVVWECIEDSGYIPGQICKDTGIFTGLTYNEFQKTVPISTHSYYINKRLAYFFDFQGPSVTVDAGCASSMVSLNSACKSLSANECNYAVVTGSNLILHPDHYITASRLLSPTSVPRSNPFGMDDGWIPSEGVISVLLKPLKQAVHDRDNIYAVIKSSHICQEGKTSWFSGFDPKKQEKVITDNFTKSGINPETITYIEPSANGSYFGDMIELEALKNVFSRYTDKKYFCSIGSVKSNVGHGEAVSTLIQLTKILLQFKIKKLLPIINLNETNKDIKLNSTPFYFQKKCECWENPVMKYKNIDFEIPRRASISSFSGSGDIGHLILEEFSKYKFQNSDTAIYYLPFSSRTGFQLYQLIRKTYKFLNACMNDVKYGLNNIMHTLATGRTVFKKRIVFIADNKETFLNLMCCYLKRQKNDNIISENISSDMNTAKYSIDKLDEYLKKGLWKELSCLWMQGYDIPWTMYQTNGNNHRVSLPTFCFKRKTYPMNIL
jgi:rhizoxin biosynthesis, polyketide synthase RhiF